MKPVGGCALDVYHVHKYSKVYHGKGDEIDPAAISVPVSACPSLVGGRASGRASGGDFGACVYHV